ncbi:hypothetical protein JCM21714_1743 [Gracilibacillus boraciitolerans JCM 21714]|uniref:Uncharacterized protein n=1 Tax=Gracilibacillus boraciitolerans JCM 21714 TaxID=1298598 RepID=W4VHT9_9BACI|nr:hypothetical protein [Gracilibacillus boraciitolerans]GAE92731.1 hypothetical protein JCM21714_1743 [Gracilibacillus boraciitolerans JCM 21714]
MPEYELVLSILNEKGKEFIFSSYPQLEGIVSNIDEVNKEIEKWVTALTLKVM